MMEPPDLNQAITSEAGRILIESYQTWLTPKIAALEAAVVTLAANRPEGERLAQPELRVFLVPQATEFFLPCPGGSDAGESLHDAAYAAALEELAVLSGSEDLLPGYLLRYVIDESALRLMLLLPMGGWDRNQPFRGVVCVAWPGHRGLDFPFSRPGQYAALPRGEAFSLLPLPPRFERTTQKDDTWIALPAAICRAAEWAELESALAILSETGAKILQRLLPTLHDAAWKSMAQRVMHELSRTVSTPQPMLEEAHKAVYAAHSSVQEAAPALDAATGDNLLRHLKTIHQNLEGMESGQEYMISKVRWFFHLVADDLRGEAPELHPLQAIITQAATALGRTPETDLVIEKPDSPLWQRTFALPRLFPQHCMEALFSNSFLHRDSAYPVRFSIRASKDGDYRLEWCNRADRAQHDRLRSELEKPPTNRSFGLRMADEISTAFFGQPMQIRLDTQAGGTMIHHQLTLPGSMLVARA